MVKQCLHNVASGRPTAGELLACLQSVTADIEGAYGELEKLDAVRQVAMVKKLAGQEAERSSQMREKNNEIRQLQHQLEHSQVCTITNTTIFLLLYIDIVHNEIRDKTR